MIRPSLPALTLTVSPSWILPGGERVLHMALDRTLERPGAIDRVLTGFGEPSLGGLIQLEHDLAVGEQSLQPLEFDFDDLAHLGAAEPAEQQYLVEPVEEFRPSTAI